MMLMLMVCRCRWCLLRWLRHLLLLLLLLLRGRLQLEAMLHGDGHLVHHVLQLIVVRVRVCFVIVHFFRCVLQLPF